MITDASSLSGRPGTDGVVKERTSRASRMWPTRWGWPQMYNAAGADGLVFYDITAQRREARPLRRHPHPGGQRDLVPSRWAAASARWTISTGCSRYGADKVSVNSRRTERPRPHRRRRPRRYGDQCVVPLRRRQAGGRPVPRLCRRSGREDTGRDALEWIKWCVDNGAGEVAASTASAPTVFGTASTSRDAGRRMAGEHPHHRQRHGGQKEDFLRLFHHKRHRRGPCGGHLPLHRAAHHPGLKECKRKWRGNATGPCVFARRFRLRLPLAPEW